MYVHKPAARCERAKASAVLAKCGKAAVGGFPIVDKVIGNKLLRLVELLSGIFVWHGA